VIIAGGIGHQQVKRLAYDLCKTVPLLPSDYSLLVDGVKVCFATEEDVGISSHTHTCSSSNSEA
jgi:hypothetical protein